MNSQINKDLFTETGCIKYDRLLQYHKGKLTAGDKHDVEKHLIDCALCSDAAEGLILAPAGKAIDEINKSLGELTNPKKDLIVKNYILAAASIAAIVVLSIFTYQQFKDAKIERTTVAESVKQPEQIQLQNNNQQTDITIADSGIAVQNSTTLSQEQSQVQQRALIKNEKYDDVAYSEPSMQAAPEKLPVLERLKNVAPLDSVTEASELATTAFNDAVGKSATGTYESGNFITYVDNLKVIDYKDVDSKSISDETEEKSTAAIYQNKEKKEAAVAEESKSGVSVSRKVTYTGLISKPIMLYNEGRYESAVKGFDEILAIHPEDQNAIFYKGMSLYQLKNFNQSATLLSKVSKVAGSPFKEEAQFYVAKSYIGMQDFEKGKLLLQDIAHANGFYAKQAMSELKNLKK